MKLPFANTMNKDYKWLIANK